MSEQDATPDEFVEEGESESTDSANIDPNTLDQEQFGPFTLSTPGEWTAKRLGDIKQLITRANSRPMTTMEFLLSTKSVFTGMVGISRTSGTLRKTLRRDGKRSISQKVETLSSTLPAKELSGAPRCILATNGERLTHT